MIIVENGLNVSKLHNNQRVRRGLTIDGGYDLPDEIINFWETLVTKRRNGNQ